MRHIVTLLLACCACGNQPPAPPTVQPQVSLPHAEASAPNQLGKDTIRITLTRDGRVAYQGRWVTLEQLGKAIKHEWPAGRDVDVLLRCDRAAPWLHAMWLLQVCAESRLCRTHFAVRNERDTPGADRDSPRVVECFLPVDLGLCVATGPPRPALKIAVRVVWVDSRWRFGLGREPARDLDSFEQSIRSLMHETRSDWSVGPVVEIRAPNHAPIEAVLAAIGTLRKCGAPAFEFSTAGNRFARKIQRDRVVLATPLAHDIPAPRRSWTIVDSFVVDGVLYYDEEEEEPLDD